MVKLTQKGQARYEQILEKSMFLFNEKGYVNTGMDEIATACSCDVANLYNYFPSKEHLLHDVIKAMIAGALDMFDEVDKDEKLHPSQKLRTLIQKQMEGRIRLGFTDLYSKYKTNLDPVHARDIVSMRDQYDYKLRELIRDGIASGDFRDTDVKIAVIAIGAFIERIVVWYSPKGKLSLSEVTDTYCDLLFNGIGLKEKTSLRRGKPSCVSKSPSRARNKRI